MEEQKQEQEQKEQTQKAQEPVMDFKELLQEELDRRAKDLGYESWDDMQAKHLEQQGRLYELIEKTKKEAEEKTKALLDELERERREKLDILTQYEVKQKLAQRDVVDVEKAFKLLRAEAQIEVKNGKVYINSEEADKYIEKFLQENSFLLKAKGSGSGAGHTTSTERPATPVERIRQGLEKLLGGR